MTDNQPKCYATFDVRCWMFDVRLFLLIFAFTSRAIAADYTVTKDPAGPPLVGFGAQMNPYLYCTPNWPGEINEQNVKDFEAKVVALGPQHVRIFMLPKWFKGEEDPVSKNDPRIAESLIRTCRLAQTAGASINLTHWYGPKWTDPEKQMAELAEVLRKLVRDENLSAVRYVTVQNEVNGQGQNTPPMETYDRLYRALDAELKKLGLREQVKIVSGDLVSENQRPWLEHIAANLSNVSDGYSIHAYWDYWDTPKLQRRLRESRTMWDALPPAQRRPMYVTEFGVRGKRPQPKVEPGTHEDGRPIADTPLQAMQLAWFTLEALDRGYVAMVIWTMEDAWYDRFMPYGVIGGVKEGWPLKPGYHVLRLFTHTCKPGWRAMKIMGTAEGRTVAAVRGNDNEFTVYALNQTAGPRTVRIGGLRPGMRLRSILWNNEGHGKLTAAETVKTGANGEVFLNLCPLEMIALTTEAFEP